MKTDGSDAKAPATKRDDVATMLEKLRPQLERALPKHVTADRMARVALTAIRQSPKLQSAEPMSLMAAIMVAAQLGLEPNTPLGQCYVIPYNDKRSGRINAQFQIGYKGVLDLAHRSRQYKRIGAYAVDAADEFSYSYGLHPQLVHVPATKPSGKSVFFYAVYELENGGQDFRVWSREKIEAHAKQYSQAYRSGKTDSPWFTAFDQMAMKTVLLDVLRYAPKSVETQKAMELDNALVSIRPEDPELEIHAEWEAVEQDHAPEPTDELHLEGNPL